MDLPRDDGSDTWDDLEAPARPVAPPTTQGEVRRAGRSAWPTVIGVISIVLGILGALSGLFGVVTTALLPQLMPQMQGFQLRGPVLIASIASSALNALVALLLLIAGIGLAMRRRWSVGTLRTWAVMKIVLGIAGVAIGWWVQTAMRQSQQQANPMGSGMVAAMQAAGLLFGLLWALAWPIICLAWLARAPVRSEWETWR